MIQQLIDLTKEKLANNPKLSFAKSVIYGAPNIITNLATPAIIFNIDSIKPVPQGSVKTVVEATFNLWVYGAVLSSGSDVIKDIQTLCWYYSPLSDAGLYPALLDLRNKEFVQDSRRRKWYLTGLGEPKFFSESVDKNVTGGVHITITLSCCVQP